MVECKWLPALYDYPDWNNYNEYENMLYNFFENHYLKSVINFKGRKIQFRYQPIEGGKIEAFYHIICKNYTEKNNRQPDTERIIRIPWARAFIENYNCTYDCCSEKPLYWNQLGNRGAVKHYIYFQRYLVIMEERENYFLFITAFFVEEEYYHRKLLKDFQKAENATG